MSVDEISKSVLHHVHRRGRPSGPLLAALSLLVGFVLPLSLSEKASAQIIDTAQMFSSSTVFRANQIIARMHVKTGKTIWVGTFAGIPADISKSSHHASLHQLFYQWAGKIGRSDHVNGVVIIICRKPGYLIIRGGRSVLNSGFSRSNEARASRLMLALFRSGQFQSGLLTGLQFISSTIEQHTAAAVPRTRGRSVRSHRVLVLVIVLAAIFFAFWLLTRRSRPMEGFPMSGSGGAIDSQTSGLTPNTTPVAAGPPSGGSSAMGTFVSGMAGGVVGAVAGNMLYNAVEGQPSSSSSPDQPAGVVTGADTTGISTPDPVSDWTGDDAAAGGAFDDSTDTSSADGDDSDDSSDDSDSDDGGAF